MRSTFISFLNHFPCLKSGLQRFRYHLFALVGISSGSISLRGIKAKKEAQRLRNSWQDHDLPNKQRELVDQQLELYRSNKNVDVFDVFIDALRALPELSSEATLLEVGCSSGYYFEVIKLAGLHIQYTGCDYSSAFIKMAREKYPSIDFAVEDASDLSYIDDSFDVVVSGCCILHIPDYPTAVSEAVRVARNYVLFHRTPVVWGQPEQYYYKKAYGIETIEIHFNEFDFLLLLSENNLELIAIYTLSEQHTDQESNRGQAIRTYVCKKKI